MIGNKTLALHYDCPKLVFSLYNTVKSGIAADECYEGLTENAFLVYLANSSISIFYLYKIKLFY